MNDRFLGGTDKPHKVLELVGWCILMFGISIEVAVAGWSANDAWQTRQIAIKNDPNNLPIASVSAQVILVYAGTNRLNIDPVRLGACNLTIGSSQQTNFWRPGLPWNLCCSSGESIPRNDSTGENTMWMLYFKQDVMFPNFSGSVKDATTWDTIKLQAAFIPNETIILGGTVRLTINSTFRDFVIPL
jgi:hypothetical protein